MKITKVDITSVYSRGSCNFCSKGTLKISGFGLEYPYIHVLEVRGESISVRFCEECFNKLKSIGFNNIKELENDLDTSSIIL